MSGQGMAKRLRVYPQAPVVCLIVTLVCLPCRDVAAQVRQSYAGEVSATDAYGNAVPRYPYRRRVGTFGDEPEQGRLRRVQVESGRVARRGVLSALARPNDMFRMMQARRSQYPYPAGSVSPVIRGTYARYGGFARRAPSGQPGDMRAVFQRRQALIRATALNAPVHRARMMHGLEDMGLPTAVAGLGAPDTKPAELLTGVKKLGERLRADVTRSHAKTRAEGWDWFHKGNEDSRYYRRAARAFKAAVTIDPMDFESRIGELFSHLSLGAFRTSVVLLAKLSRRDPAMFSHTLDFRQLYADAVHARQIWMQCEAYAQASEGDPGVVALHVFVLWYSGERDQAIITADALAGAPGGQRFADWGKQMRDVTSR